MHLQVRMMELLKRKTSVGDVQSQRVQKQTKVQGQKRSAEDHVPDDFRFSTQSHRVAVIAIRGIETKFAVNK